MLTRAARAGRDSAGAAVLLVVLSAAASGTLDHRNFSSLHRRFKDGREVTRACLACHTSAATDIEATSHWQWLGRPASVPAHAGLVRLGKRNAINNFCIGIQSNEESCSKCHISFGWKGGRFDFSRHENIDCLSCHDGTGEYVKKPAGEGNGGEEPMDWAKLAQSVAPTSVRTCGSCHFQGGGGEGVKHGDLDSSLIEAQKTLDVHMAKDGLGFSCSACHRGEEIAHRIKGRLSSLSADRVDFVACEQCHGGQPHGRDFVFRSQRERIGAAHFASGAERFWPWQSLRRNWHTRRIACQTCHIPAFAREEATKISWDWSTAGRRRPDGRPVTEYDDDGNISYLGIKGSFKWAKNVMPAYRWWNGTSGHYLLGDAFDPSKTLVLNPPIGGPDDPGSKIWPFKVHQGRQPYDPVNRILIQPHLSGKKGSGAFWADYHWEIAARQGMAYAHLPFSGRVGFARTEMYWPISHMVTQGDRGVSCAECHSRKSRLADVGGVYIPGFDRNGVLDFFGWLSAALSLFGISLHGLLRWLANRGRLNPLLKKLRWGDR